MVPAASPAQLLQNLTSAHVVDLLMMKQPNLFNHLAQIIEKKAVVNNSYNSTYYNFVAIVA